MLPFVRALSIARCLSALVLFVVCVSFVGVKNVVLTVVVIVIVVIIVVIAVIVVIVVIVIVVVIVVIVIVIVIVVIVVVWGQDCCINCYITTISTDCFLLVCCCFNGCLLSFLFLIPW